MENNENQTRKSKTKNSTKPKTEKEEGLKKRPILEMALYYSFGSEYSWSCVYCHSRD
nr:hypothetical protein [Lactococcus lactis]